MNSIIEKNSYFFENIFPYLSIKEQKKCLKAIKKEIKSIQMDKSVTEDSCSKRRK